MAIDIEAPGGNETALKAALRDLVGALHPISSFSIDSAVAAVDIDLPAGYSRFKLIVQDLTLTAGSFDPLRLQFSDDGGDTFIDSGYEVTALSSIPNSVNFWNNNEAAARITLTSLADVGDTANAYCTAECTIWPGSADGPPILTSLAGFLNHASGNTKAEVDVVHSVLPGVAARHDAVRVATFIPGDQMATGTFELWGVPS